MTIFDFTTCGQINRQQLYRATNVSAQDIRFTTGNYADRKRACCLKGSHNRIYQASGKELATYDISANAVCVGAIRIAMWNKIPAARTRDKAYLGSGSLTISSGRSQSAGHRNPYEVAKVVQFF